MKDFEPTAEEIDSFLYPLAALRWADTDDSHVRDSHVYHPTSVKGNAELFSYLCGRVMGPLPEQENAILNRWQTLFDSNQVEQPIFHESWVTKRIKRVTAHLLSQARYGTI